MEQIIETYECSNKKCRNNQIRVQPIKEFYDKNGKLTKRCLTCRNYDKDHRKDTYSDALKNAQKKYQSTNHYKEIKKNANIRYFENHPDMKEKNKEAAKNYYYNNYVEVIEKRYNKKETKNEIKSIMNLIKTTY